MSNVTLTSKNSVESDPLIEQASMYFVEGLVDGLWPLDLISIFTDNNFLFVTDVNGNLQIYEKDSGDIEKISHLDFINTITHL